MSVVSAVAKRVIPLFDRVLIQVSEMRKITTVYIINVQLFLVACRRGNKDERRLVDP